MQDAVNSWAYSNDPGRLVWPINSRRQPIAKRSSAFQLTVPLYIIGLAPV
jgi:hypothetical protein